MTETMDADAYLARIGYRGGREPNAANLAALVKAHRHAVPYETLDLWRGRHTSLATEAIYDKIVTRGRGGYCFELNGLFAWLLRELGYSVREYFGRWLMNEELAVPKRRHRVVCVALEGRANQIADVGIGMPLVMEPLGLVFDVPQTRGTQLYRVVRDAVLGAVVEIRRRDGAWTRVFSFDTAPQLPIDFAYAHWWCETHPSSDFRRKLWVFRPCADGAMKSIATEPDPEGGEPVPTYMFTPPKGEPVKTFLRTEAALAAALEHEFGIREI